MSATAKIGSIATMRVTSGGHVVLALPLRRVPRPFVLEAEEATGEPPFDRTPERRPVAPAVRVATALAITWVVDASQKASSHDPIVDRSPAPL